MYRHVLVPVDLSHEAVASRILAVARFLAGETGRITLLHVQEPVPAYVAHYLPQDTMDKAGAAAHGRLEALAGEAGAGTTIMQRLGHPAIEILHVAKEAGCDAIVLGSHRPDMSDYFLGSTASRVVRHAPCTVVVERSAVTP
jgi:universal stress protein F